MVFHFSRLLEVDKTIAAVVVFCTCGAGKAGGRRQQACRETPELFRQTLNVWIFAILSYSSRNAGIGIWGR